MNKYKIFVEVNADSEEEAWEKASDKMHDYSMFGGMEEIFSIECEPENNISVCAYCGGHCESVNDEPFHDEDGYICYDIKCEECGEISVEKYEASYVETVKGDEDGD